MRLLFLSTPSARRATYTRTAVNVTAEDFYPRPPRGGRLLPTWPAMPDKSFLSTPSARRATLFHQMKLFIVNISIHALREEGDQFSSCKFS